MKISILTPSFNQGEYIENNIQSVLNQNCNAVEHIVIDGGSTDNTLNILNEYPHLKWTSEPDEGQADALNKGLSIATGDIIGWINSDDYYEDNIFQDVLNHFKDPDVKWIIGNVTFVYTGPGIERHIQSKKITYMNLLKNPDILKQQGVFFRKDVLVEVESWNKGFHMAMDFDLWVRISKKYPPKMVNKNYAFFLWHPDQKSTYKNALKQISEINKILANNDVKILNRYIFIAKKLYYFFKGFVKNILIHLKILDPQYSSIPLSLIK